ncbi:ASST-domain-containing protein [Aspergillus granulosus]|uniref:ASST-domain-containing protein n=1 Tax=Aspergillus granulosus TaxID=176169 RepID=A0ABR4GSU0_9EURO
MAILNWAVSRCRRLDSRRSLFHIATWGTILGVLYLFCLFVVPQLLRFHFRTDLSWYDLGAYGFGPSRSYASFQYESPLVEITAGDGDNACDDRYTFLAPRGDSVVHPGPMIIDANGELVWMKPSWETTQNFQVQRFQGEDFLTYWEGEQIDGKGYGSWYMLDSTYTIRYVINPVGNFGGDIHEFHITPEGTALVTIYDPILADLESIGGPKMGWIYDSLFQELDIASGKLIFEWRASEKFPVNSTYETLSEGGGKERANAFDFFHINSIDKDEQGDYIISSRHTHTISCISRLTGDIIWTLGGKSNDFQDLSDGEATSFSWQHDARWHADSGTLTLFDNAVHAYGDSGRESRGMAIQLDIPNREAAVLATFHHPHQQKSVSQGNVQLLDDEDRVIIGWGHSAAYSEFDTKGKLLCNVHFGASAFFNFGRVVSYRVLKGGWVGNPQTRPDAVVVGDMIYVSWNGATEVVSWRLETWDGNDIEELGRPETFTSIGNFAKTGFETEISVPDGTAYRLFQLAALDEQGNTLQTTNLLQLKSESGMVNDLIVRAALVMGVFGLVAVFCQSKRFFTWRSFYLSRKNAYELAPQ